MMDPGPFVGLNRYHPTIPLHTWFIKGAFGRYSIDREGLLKDNDKGAETAPVCSKEWSYEVSYHEIDDEDEPDNGHHLTDFG